jgi:hypothetical protein
MMSKTRVAPSAVDVSALIDVSVLKRAWDTADLEESTWRIQGAVYGLMELSNHIEFQPIEGETKAEEAARASLFFMLLDSIRSDARGLENPLEELPRHLFSPDAEVA